MTHQRHGSLGGHAAGWYGFGPPWRRRYRVQCEHCYALDAVPVAHSRTAARALALAHELTTAGLELKLLEVVPFVVEGMRPRRELTPWWKRPWRPRP